MTFMCIERGRERISNRKLDSGVLALDPILPHPFVDIARVWA